MAEGPLEIRISASGNDMEACARVDGAGAFEAGRGLWANPHVPRTHAWFGWYRGYVAAGLDPDRVARRRATLEAEVLAARARARAGAWRALGALLLLAVMGWLIARQLR